MPEIAGFVDISAPRQAVWNLLSDVGRYTEFGTITDVATLVSEGEFGDGSVYTESGKIAGMKSESEWTVTRFAPPSEQIHVGKESSMEAELTWTLDEIDVGTTRATQVLDFKMMPGFRPLGVLLEAVFATRFMTQEMERIRQDLKRIAERESGTESG